MTQNNFSDRKRKNQQNIEGKKTNNNRNKKLPKEGVATTEKTALAWFETILHWTLEKVPLELEVSYPRKLTALEWVLLRILKGFPIETPLFHEIVEELGLQEERFLRDALEEILKLKAIERRENVVERRVEERELADYHFTEIGKILFERGQIEANTTQRACFFYFDPTTDEALPPSVGKDCVETLEEKVPFPALAERAKPRTHVGLDRVRSLVEEFDKDLLKEGGEIKEATPIQDFPAQHVWWPVHLSFFLEKEGNINIKIKEKLAKSMNTLIENENWVTNGLLPMITDGWPPSSLFWERETGIAFVDWANRVTESFANEDTEEKVLRCIKAAQKEIIAHVCWRNNKRIEKALEDAVQRGVCVLEIGAEKAIVSRWYEVPKWSFVLGCSVKSRYHHVVLIDGMSGVVLERVRLRWGEAERPMVLVGNLKEEQVKNLWNKLKHEVAQKLPPFSKDSVQVPTGTNTDGESVSQLLKNDSLRLALARAGFGKDQQGWDVLVEEIGQTTDERWKSMFLSKLEVLGKDRGLTTKLCSGKQEKQRAASQRGNKKAK